MILPLIAVPVLNPTTGLWIGSVGFIAGSSSSTWIGSFILANSSLLTWLGLASSAGIFAAAGGSFAALGTSATLALGSAMGAVGLGGLASALGIVPIAALLGLTPVGWTIIGVAVLAAIGTGIYAFWSPLVEWIGEGLVAVGLRGVAEWLGIAPEPTYFGLTAAEWASMITAIVVLLLLALFGSITRATMLRINEERRKGGEAPITVVGILMEIRDFERRSRIALLRSLAAADSDLRLAPDEKTVEINGRSYREHRLRYMIETDGWAVITFRPFRFGRAIPLLRVRPAAGYA